MASHGPSGDWWIKRQRVSSVTGGRADPVKVKWSSRQCSGQQIWSLVQQIRSKLCAAVGPLLCCCCLVVVCVSCEEEEKEEREENELWSICNFFFKWSCDVCLVYREWAKGRELYCNFVFFLFFFLMTNPIGCSDRIGFNLIGSWLWFDHDPIRLVKFHPIGLGKQSDPILTRYFSDRIGLFVHP